MKRSTGKIRTAFYSILCFAMFIFAYQYGESLISKEWISRLDYILLFLAGFIASLCFNLFIRLELNGSTRNSRGLSLWVEPIKRKEPESILPE